MQLFDSLKSQYRDIVWLANVTLFSTTLKCGTAFLQGNIAIEQPLFDELGNHVCSIYVPMEYAKNATYSLLTSKDDDIVFQLVPPQPPNAV